MTLIKRTCENCIAFNPAHTDEEPSCWNFVTIVIHHHDGQNPVTIKRQPWAGFTCEDHKTREEDRADDAAVSKFWERLGIEVKG